MKKILVNYRFTPSKEWLGEDYLIYDRSEDKTWLVDFPQEKIIYTENVGNVDLDKLNYLIDNYDNLSEVFLWGKTNLFKYLEREEYEKVKDNREFTPLLTKNHKTYTDKMGPVCFYCDGIYWERNPMLYSSEYKYFKDFPEFAKEFNLESGAYIPFVPGGNYILTKEKVHRYPKEFYQKMANILPYTREPIEAHFCERSYHQLWK